MALLAAVALLATAGRSGAATSGDAALEARVEAGFDGYAAPGRPTPVRVTLTSSELRSGELRIAMANGPAEVTDFEIAGGSSEEHWALLDTPSNGNSTVTVSARIDGRDVDLGTSQLDPLDDAQLVGTLPGLSGVETGDMQTSVAGQTIHLVALDPGVLDLGPSALAALDAVAVTPEDVAALSDAHREAILGWLVQGGTLYVDAAPGTLAAWPEALQPVAPVVRDGVATVVSTGGALSEGRWSDVVLAAPSRSIQEDGVVAQGIPFADSTGEMFGVDLGRDLPPLSELLAILGLYTLVVGPIVYLAFRRRVMWRWVAIPALAVLAAGILFVRGGGPGPETTASVVEIVETGPGPAMVTTRVLMSTDVGEQHVVAPAGWTARTGESLNLPIGPQVTQHRSADGVELSVPAQAGGVGVLTAQGPAAVEGALEVTATATEDGTVTGTVRNTTGVTLDEVVVFFARTTATPIGSLEPGAAAEYTLTGADQTVMLGMDVFQQSWPGSAGSTFGPMTVMPTIVNGNGVQGQIIMGGGGMNMQCDESGNCFPTGMPSATCLSGNCPTGPARPGSLSAALRPRGANAMSFGTVTAVGWTSELRPNVDLGSGVDVVESQTAIVGQAAPTVPGDRLVAAASTRRVVSASSNVGEFLDITFSHDLPTQVGGRAIDLGRLRMHMPLVFGRVEVLTPDGPRLLRDIDPNVPGDASEELVVPPEAVVDGRVLYSVRLRPNPPPPGPDMSIYEVPL